MNRMMTVTAVALVAAFVVAAVSVSVVGQDGAAAAGASAEPAAKKPLEDPNFFPIGVWAQQPRNAAKYAALGVNLYLSIDGNPTAETLAELKKNGIYLICHQNDEALKFKDDPTIMGWMHGDEPDNFTKGPDGKWIPKKKPDAIIADYEEVKKKDPSRPVLLNLGQGVANVGYKGGWAKDADYSKLVKGCDIVSYDIYPACSDRAEVAGKLWLVSKGVDRLMDWTAGKKTVWFITEASAIRNTKRRVTADEMRAEIWMALTHGATGIIYFCHQWEPTKDFALPIHDAEMGEAVKRCNAEVKSLAAVLNSPTIKDGATVESSNKESPIDVLVKKHGGATYVFAVNMRDGETKGSFTVGGLNAKSVAEVIGENRTIDLDGAGRFSDDFKGYKVHLYKITPAANFNANPGA